MRLVGFTIEISGGLFIYRFTDGCLTLTSAALHSRGPYQYDLCCNSSDCCAQ